MEKLMCRKRLMSKGDSESNIHLGFNSCDVHLWYYLFWMFKPHLSEKYQCIKRNCMKVLFDTKYDILMMLRKDTGVTQKECNKNLRDVSWEILIMLQHIAWRCWSNSRTGAVQGSVDRLVYAKWKVALAHGVTQGQKDCKSVLNSQSLSPNLSSNSNPMQFVVRYLSCVMIYRPVMHKVPKQLIFDSTQLFLKSQ